MAANVRESEVTKLAMTCATATNAKQGTYLPTYGYKLIHTDYMEPMWWLHQALIIIHISIIYFHSDRLRDFRFSRRINI